MFTHVKTKKSILPLLSFLLQSGLYHFHARFNVALLLCMIMTVMLSGWSLSRLLLAFLQHQAEFCLCFHKHLLNPVVPVESTMPTYMWYLRAIPNEDFKYHLKTLFKSFLFVTVQAHGAVRRNQYLSCQKYLTEVLTSQMQKRKVALPPYLMME